MIKFLHTKRSPVKIVADGLLSTPTVGEGRFIPALILQTTDRPDIDELLRVHQHTPPGDVIIQWAFIPFRPRGLILQMRFENPMACEFEILFDVEKHGALIDAIMYAQAVYIQTGHPGDSLAGSMCKGTPRIMAEVPRTDNFDSWNKRIHRIMTRKMRDKGLDRNTARRAADEMLKSIREMWDMRRS